MRTLNFTSTPGYRAMLTGGDRLAAARHRTLAATVDWSYQLLSEDERLVFRQVSMFPGHLWLVAQRRLSRCWAPSLAREISLAPLTFE